MAACATRRSLVTTNRIESKFDIVRDVSKRVTRSPTGTMTLRWALAGIGEVEKSFCRLRAMKDMPKLMAALRARDVVAAPNHATSGTAASGRCVTRLR